MSQPNMPGYRPPMPQYGKSQLTDEQRRRQRTVIGGVVGCLGVLFLLSLVAAFFAVRAAKGVFYTGAVDRTTMQQKLGSDIPLYPNGVVDELMTRTMLSTTGFMGKMMSKLGGVEPSAVALGTNDSDQAILDYYRRELGAGGWREAKTQRTARGDQHTFQKGEDMLILQIQDHPQGPQKRLLVLMRMRIPTGGSNTAPQPGGGPAPAPGASPAPGPNFAPPTPFPGGPPNIPPPPSPGGNGGGPPFGPPGGFPQGPGQISPPNFAPGR